MSFEKSDFASLPGDGNASWVHNYTASWVVETLGCFAPNFPAPTASQAEMQDFWRQVMWVSAFVAVLAVFSALLLTFFLCCCHQKPRTNVAGGPLCFPFLMFSIVTAIGVILEAYWTDLAGKSSYSAVGAELGRARDEFVYAAGQAQVLNSTSVMMTRNVESVITFCSSWNWAVTAEPSVSLLKAELSLLNKDVKLYHTAVSALPRLLDTAVDHSEDLQSWLSTAWRYPVLFMAAAYVGVMLVVASSESMQRCGSTCAIRTRRCSIPALACTVTAPALLGIGIVSWIELSLGIATSSACLGHLDLSTTTWLNANVSGLHHISGIDRTLITYAAKHSDFDPDLLSMTEYYVTGVGSNIVEIALQDALYRLRQVSRTIGDYSSALVCNDTGETFDTEDLVWHVKEAVGIIRHLLRRLQPKVIYPYYSAAVHDGLCGASMQGFAALVFFQVVVGLCCIPMLTMTAGIFLDSMAAVRYDGGHQYSEMEMLDSNSPRTIYSEDPEW